MEKSKTRIYINKIISANLLIYIKNKQHHFLKNVMRIKVDDKVNIFDGLSGEWESIVISINRDNIILRVIKILDKIKHPNDIWLIFGPIKQNRMSIAMQKATELGVAKIIPCITEYTNIRKINSKNIFDNAIEAAEQSGRLDIPKIEKQMNLETLLSNWPMDRKLIFCDEKLSSNNSIYETLIPFKNSINKLALLTGPEGGFSNKERNLILKNKATISVSLGNKVLRSDTAITVGLFAIQQLFI